jgi:hypothetical protein
MITTKETEMKKLYKMFFAAALLASFSIAPTAFAKDANSGFLGDYSKLKEVKDAAGDKVMRYVNPKLKPGAYQSVLLDPTQYYPAPKATAQVPASTLTAVSNYVDKEMRAKLLSKLSIASEPGPGVLRLRLAITAEGSKTPNLKPYQYIPFAFIATEVIGRGKVATIKIEAELVDSVSGELMGAAVRDGVGAKLANDKAVLELKDLQPLLDKWIATSSTFIADSMK